LLPAAEGAATVLSKGALEAMPPIALLAVQLASSVAFLFAILPEPGISGIADDRQQPGPL
jgi:hypothetical protein